MEVGITIIPYIQWIPSKWYILTGYPAKTPTTAADDALIAVLLAKIKKERKERIQVSQWYLELLKGKRPVLPHKISSNMVWNGKGWIRLQLSLSFVDAIVIREGCEEPIQKEKYKELINNMYYEYCINKILLTISWYIVQE